MAKIGSHAFEDCVSLASVSIPGSVTEIDGAAFAGCTSLASVSIPEGVTEIGWGAFDGCISLKEIRYGGTKEQWKALEKGRHVNETAVTFING